MPRPARSCAWSTSSEWLSPGSSPKQRGARCPNELPKTSLHALAFPAPAHFVFYTSLATAFLLAFNYLPSVEFLPLPGSIAATDLRTMKTRFARQLVKTRLLNTEQLAAAQAVVGDNEEA